MATAMETSSDHRAARGRTFWGVIYDHGALVFSAFSVCIYAILALSQSSVWWFVLIPVLMVVWAGLVWAASTIQIPGMEKPSFRPQDFIKISVRAVVVAIITALWMLFGYYFGTADNYWALVAGHYLYGSKGLTYSLGHIPWWGLVIIGVLVASLLAWKTRPKFMQASGAQKIVIVIFGVLALVGVMFAYTLVSGVFAFFNGFVVMLLLGLLTWCLIYLCRWKSDLFARGDLLAFAGVAILTGLPIGFLLMQMLYAGSGT